MVQQISPMPTPAPSRSMEQSVFDAAVAARIVAEQKRDAQYNTLALEVNQNTLSASKSAATALQAVADAQGKVAQAQDYANDSASAALAAATVAGATKWVSGENVAAGVCKWSPSDGAVYRARVAMTPTTADPATDSSNTYWQPLARLAFDRLGALTISADTSLTSISQNVLTISSSVRGASLFMPNAITLAGRNAVTFGKNIGNFVLPIRDQSGALLAVVPKGATFILVCCDNSTSAGQWEVTCPETRVGQILSTAVCDTIAVTAMGACNIPGVANKGIVHWAGGGTLKMAIASVNPTTKAVTLGAVVSTGVAVSLNAPGNVVVCACSPTAAIVSQIDGSNQRRSRSLTLDTVANTISMSAEVVTSAGIAASGPSHPQVLDANRVAWFNSGYIWIAYHGGGNAPSLTYTDISSVVGNYQTSQIVHVGGGNLLAIGTLGMGLYGSGSNPVAISTTAFSGAVLSSNGGAQVGFGFGSNNAAFVQGLSASDSASGDVTYTVKCNGGTTIPAGPAERNLFPSNSLSRSDILSMQAFVAGSSYCMSARDSTTYTWSMRVMRATSGALTEVACGTPDALPIAGGTFRWGVSNGLDNQLCLLVSTNMSNYPQVSVLEVIKA